MKGKDKRNGQTRPEGETSEFGVVRVISKPVPDAEDRLRRLFTLLLDHAARERQGMTETDPLPDAQQAANHLEAEA